MPDIKPFRALRFDPDVAGDLGLIVAPPYDVIGPELHQRLLARHARNVVRLDLPLSEPMDADPDDKYRRVARTLAAWRSDGTLRKDPRPGVYVYEQAYRVPNTDVERTQRGFFARLRLEPFGPGSGVLPHERTLSGPKEDRYRLLRATGRQHLARSSACTRIRRARQTALLATIAARPAECDVTDDDGVRHRLWVVTDDADDGRGLPRSRPPPGRDRSTIADGHHRYETALRYRDERRMTRSCEEDPPFDFLLMLFLDDGDAADGPADPPCRARPWRGRAHAPRSTGSPGCSTLTPSSRGGADPPVRRGGRARRAARAGSGS